MIDIDFKEIIKFQKRYDASLNMPLCDIEKICLEISEDAQNYCDNNINHYQVLEDVLEFYKNYNFDWYQIIISELEKENIRINKLFFENSGWFHLDKYRIEIVKKNKLADILVYAHEFAHAIDYILNDKNINEYEREILPLKMEEEITKYYEQKYLALRDIFNLRINEINSIYVDNVLCEIDLYKKFDSGHLLINKIDQFNYENIKILNELELMIVYTKYIYASYKLQVAKPKTKKK